VTVLDDGRPSAVARVMGAAQWCCSSCSIYSNRLDSWTSIELLEVKGCLHTLFNLSSCNPVYYPVGPSALGVTNPSLLHLLPLPHSVSHSSLVHGRDWSAR